jgi:antitoxin component YwqK of YwqJK toxin-antitoxin module
MELKALSRNNFLKIVTIFSIISGCIYFYKKKPITTEFKKDYSIDLSIIPKDTVFFTDKNLSIVNGMYKYKDSLFSGIIYEFYSNKKLKKELSIYKGMLYGTCRSYFEDGKPWEIRNYRNNLSVGKQYGFWEDSGNPLFEFNYYEDKMEGLQKKWYKSGQAALFLNYVNDKEEGLQQGWRENGKLYLNYVAIDGERYGLQKSVLCYSLKEEIIE